MTITAIVATLVGYIALLFFVAWRSSRGTDSTTFFTGGRNTNSIVASVAMVGAAMSGVTYISVPGSVATDGFSYLQTCAGFFVGYVIKPSSLIEEVEQTGTFKAKKLFTIIIKYVAPICIVLILISSVLDGLGIVKI